MTTSALRCVLYALVIALLSTLAMAQDLPPASGGWATSTCPAESAAGEEISNPPAMSELHVASGYWLPIQPFLKELGYPSLEELLKPSPETRQTVRHGRLKLALPWQMSLAAAGSQPAPQPNVANQANGKPPAKEDLTEAEREILAIRKKVGSLLEGTPFQPADEEQLRQVLRKLEQQRPRPEWRPVRVRPPVCVAQTPSWTPDEHSQRGALRATAEHLDQAANMLEHQELYERADQLRNLAMELRLDARSSRRAGTAAEPPAGHREPSRLIPEQATPLERRQPGAANFDRTQRPVVPAVGTEPQASSHELDVEQNVERWTGFRRLNHPDVAALRNELGRLESLLNPTAETPLEAYLEALSKLGMQDLAETIRRNGAGTMTPAQIEWMHSQLVRIQLRLLKETLDTIETDSR